MAPLLSPALTNSRSRSMLPAIVLIMITVSVLLSGCSKDTGEKQPVVTVQAAQVQRGTIRQIVTTEAVLFPLNQSALTAKVNAPVRNFYVNRGSKVHVGQLLAVLENRDLAAAEIENKGAYEQAQANYATKTVSTVPEEVQKAEGDVQQTKVALDAAQKQYDSREVLFRQGAIARKELDAAAVALTQARAQYELAQKHLAALQSGIKEQELRAAAGELTSAKGKYLGSTAQLAYSEVRSPINGVVTDRPLFPGEMAAAGTPLITVMDLSQVIAKSHVPQGDAAVLKSGDVATISAPGIPDPIPAKVTLVSPATDPNSTTIEVWVQAANPHGQLRPGNTVQVSMIAREVQNAVVVPASALLTSPEGETTVMTVGKDGRAHQQKVAVGIRQGDEAQIVAGLQPGQTVITSGAYGLPDNTKIKVQSATQGTTAGNSKKSDLESQ